MARKRESESKTRKVKKPEYRSFRLHKKIKNPSKPIIGSFKLMRESLKHLLKNKKLYLGIASVYFLVSLVLVSGLIGGTDYSTVKESLSEVFNGTTGQLSIGISLFSMLIGGGNSITESGSVYQTTLIIMISLVSIWALRHSYAKTKITVRDAFYKSMTPFVPFVLVLIVMGLQLIPLLIGTTLYSIAIGQGLAVTVVEKVVWVLLVLGLFVLTLYMLTSSIFALYIVTLPELTPMKALRSARELVRYRRWTIMRKVIFLPISLLLLAATIMIPVLLFLTFMAQWIFAFLSAIGIIVIHSYMYKLYRELI
ncbi:hypothetical protein KDA00_02970 [Candidatus Saccharibacteria bacterium]|nr:hypothetical protein [Candidatus Saccharibacteria bacterium]